MQKKITMPQLKKIIGEELRLSLKEAVDHASIREVVNDASKLLAAVEAFKKSANGSMMNALTPQISDIEKVLEDMVSTPGSYVEKQKTKPQKVSLKPAKSGKTLLSLLSLFKVVVLELLQQNEGANNMAKKQTKQSLFKRLTRLFKSGPVIKKKIRNADTSIAVADKTKSSGTLLFQKSLAPTYATITANAYNLSERLMRYQDYQEMEMCISGDTKIAVPNGYKTIRELAKECENDLEKTFIVYSYDHNKGQIVPALGKQARQTSVDHAWKVTFDSGLSITTSAGHRLMLRDGTYRKLEELQVGDSMMPFYRKDLFSNENNENSSSGGYSWIYTMDSTHKSWTREHVLIAEWVSGRRLTKDECVHHINFVRSDNRPENLLIMNKFEHSSYHAKINNEKKWHVNNKEWIDKFKKTHSEWMKVNNPAERRDVTFGRILETCEKIGFNQSAVCSALDVSVTVIQNRLKKHGFSNFELFAKTYCNDWKNSGWNNSGENNPRFDKTLTFACICNAYTNDMSAKKLADMLGTTVTKIMNRIRTAGYKNYSDFSAQFTNHKIESIEYVGVIPLYDLTVDGYKNFATDSVVSHNTPEISSALDIYADETVAADEKGRALHIYSDNERVKEILEDLFYGTLNLEFNLRSWARNLVKYGDFFLYNDVSDDYGVVSAFPIPVNEIEREENYDREDPFAVRYRWVTLGNRILENWEVSHFRLLGNDMFLPYGSSVIEPARRIWRQLILIEDAMLVYRVVRAPERRVFYIDVGNIPASEVELYVEQQRKKLRTNQVIDSNTGRVDLRYNPMSVDEDYLMPVRGAESGTKIETLAGGQNTAAVEDVAYIQKKLFAALKIPRAYLGYDEALSSKATLAQEDIRFSRTISVIQKTIISELNKLAIIHLYAHGFDGEDLQNFTLRLSNPSTVAQQQKLELWRAKFEIAGSAPEGFVDKNFIRKEIWGLNEEQCKAIDDARLKDKIVDSTIEGAAAGEAGAGGGDAGVDDLFGGGGGEEASGGEEAGGGGEETPPEENAGEEPEEEVEPDVELLTSADSFDDDEVFGLKVGNSVRDVEVPVKAQKQLDRVLYNRGRLRTHGASKTFMPDLEKMTSNDEHESLNDPFDSNWMKSVVSNPFGESRQHERPIMTSDMMSILRNWSVAKRVNRSPAAAQKVITESNDDLDVTVEFDEVFNDDEPGEQE